MKISEIYRFFGMLTLILFAQTGLATDNAKFMDFANKDMQITVLKNPGGVIRGGLFGSSRTDDEIIIVRINGEIAKTYVTSSARNGKTTPEGVFLGVERAREKHVSSIYGSPMDYALFIHNEYAFHATTENSYDKLGRPAPAGCLRLLREDAKELFEIVLGRRDAPGATAKNYAEMNQFGVNILPGSATKSYWDSLDSTDKLTILKMARESRKKIDATVKEIKEQRMSEDRVRGNASNKERHN